MRKMLEKSLSKLVPFVAIDGSRTTLKGICIKKMEAIATDGYVLVRKELDDKTGDENESIVIPIADFAEAMQLLNKNKVMTSLIMETDKDDISLSLLNNITIKTKSIVGDYPDVEIIYPKGEPKAEIILHSNFLEKVCKLAYSVGYGNNRLRLKIYEYCVVFETNNGFNGIIMALRDEKRFT